MVAQPHPQPQRLPTAVAEAIPEAMVIFDRDGRVIVANARAHALFGYPPGGLLTSTVDDLLSARLHAAYLAERDSYLASPPTRTDLAVVVQRQDADELQVEITLTASGIGGDLLVTALIRDAVERRRREVQLRQSQKLESIARLATGVVHDFNNALTNINGYAHLVLSRMPPQDPSHADIRQIVRATEAAGRLVTQLQAFSQGEQVQVEVVDLNQSVRDVGRLLNVVLGERIELDLRLASHLPGLETNLGSLEQTVMQLALNARDAMPDGGRLTVQTEAVETPNGRRLALTLSDTGVGMDEATRLRAFEPFFTTKTSNESTGLGLTAVYALVERLGGSIDLESQPGVGTVVRLHLPAASTAAGGLAVDQPPGPGTVLMVEDDDSLRTLVDRILTDEGYHVLTAASGEAALELAAVEPGPIDLLVSDVVLGGMTGPELATKLKARRPRLKTLLMSGYPGMPIGPVDDFLPKPFSPFELARRIRRVLRP